MKKIFMCALAVVALASCQKSDVVEVAQGSAIAFDSFVNKTTKVTEADDMSKANLKAFSVFGWRNNGTAELIFNAQEVTANNGVCTYSPLQYWAAGYNYQFEAVAPVVGTNLTVAAAETGSTLTFTSDSKTDLIWARPSVISYQEATETAPAPVQLTFDHLLSRVMFQVHNYFPAEAAAKITVTDLKIVGAVSQATLTPAATDRAWAPVAGQVADVEFETSKLIDIPAGKGVAATEHQYMIPAALTKVTFKVKLDQAGVENEYDHEIELSGENVDPNAFLAINRSLRINIVLKPENIDPENALYPIEFTADVLAWN